METVINWLKVIVKASVAEPENAVFLQCNLWYQCADDRPLVQEVLHGIIEYMYVKTSCFENIDNLDDCIHTRIVPIKDMYWAISTIDLHVHRFPCNNVESCVKLCLQYLFVRAQLSYFSIIKHRLKSSFSPLSFSPYFTK